MDKDGLFINLMIFLNVKFICSPFAVELTILVIIIY